MKYQKKMSYRVFQRKCSVREWNAGWEEVPNLETIDASSWEEALTLAIQMVAGEKKISMTRSEKMFFLRGRDQKPEYRAVKAEEHAFMILDENTHYRVVEERDMVFLRP